MEQSYPWTCFDCGRSMFNFCNPRPSYHRIISESHCFPICSQITHTHSEVTTYVECIFYTKYVFLPSSPFNTPQKKKFLPEICRHCELLYFCGWAQIQSVPTVTEAEGSCYPGMQFITCVQQQSTSIKQHKCQNDNK